VGLNSHTDFRNNDENTLVSRGDVELGKHRLSLRYNYNHQNFQKPNLIITSPSTFPTRFHNAEIQDTTLISPAMVNELRLGFNRTDLLRHDSQIRDVPAIAFEFSSGINTGMDQLHFTGNTSTVADNFTLIHGKHTLKTGFEFRNVRTYRNEFLPEFQFYFSLDDLAADRTGLLGEFFGVAKSLRNDNFGIFFQDDWRASKRLQVNAGLRWEYFTPFRGGYNVNTPDPFGSFGKLGQDMWRPYHRDFGPRLGLVFDVLGNQELVVRAGGALMYTPPVMQLNYDVSFADPRLPFFATFLPTDLPQGTNLSFPFPTNFFDPFVANPSSLPADVITGRNIIDYNHRDEKALQWNLSVQYAVTPSLALQASYVGTRGLNLFSTRNLNLFSATLGARPFAGLGDVVYKEYAGRASYHALQLSANQRLYHGLNLNFYYTYAKSLSYYGSDGNLGADLSVQDPYNIRGSYGPKNSDIRHQETIVASYALPAPGFVGRSILKKAFLAGWNLEGIQSARSGEPINVFAGVDLVGNQNSNNGDRPDLVPGVNQYIRGQISPLGVGWLNPAAFDNNAPMMAHRFGNLGYNTERGPSALTFDFAVHKTFNITERQTVTFRAEAFNLLNHEVFNLPVNTLANPTFGIIQGGSDGRNVQFALKYRF
jgi:hypothetical protein